jgi:archaeosine synthase
MKEKTVILESGKCPFNCIFCGYARREPVPVNISRLKVNLDKALVDFDDGDILKIFVSGSFLDNREFPREIRQYLVKKVKEKKIKHLVIESRPEYVTDGTLADFKGLDMSIAIGLEIADDKVLKKLKKGFTLKDYEKAARTIRKNGFKVRTYLLVNLPFVKDTRKELLKSVDYARKFSDSIVLINLLPHGRSELFKMWLERKWHPLSREDFHEVTKGIKEVELDAETFRFVPRFPPELRLDLEGVGVKFIDHPHYNVWQEYIQEFYRRPEERDIALFVPCSYRKPYSTSKTHRLIYKVTKKFKRIHRIVISSPGVIPFEFNDIYPFNSYEWDESLETPEVMKEYVRITRNRIKNYLQTHEYAQVLCYFKYDSESYMALKQACEELGIGLTNCLGEETYRKYKEGGNPLFKRESLEELRTCLEKITSDRD